MDDTQCSISWSAVPGAEAYQIFAQGEETDDYHFLLSAGQPSCTVEWADSYLIYAVIGSSRSAGASVAAPERQDISESAENPDIISETCEITSVTRLSDCETVVCCKGSEELPFEIYRSDDDGQTFTLLGSTSDKYYYDKSALSVPSSYYAIQVSGEQKGDPSEVRNTGYEEGHVSGVMVMMYHEFVTQEDIDRGVAMDEYAIWEDEFEQDLIWLRDNGYTTLSTADLLAYAESDDPLPEKSIILTIDDGKLGVYRHAWPLLQKYNMKAVLAVIGERIDIATQDAESNLASEAPYCTWEQIAEMSDSGTIEIVSHTHYKHRYSDNGHTGADIGENETEEEFYVSAKFDKIYMEDTLKSWDISVVLALSYPYSARSAAADRVWWKCGYEILYAGDSEEVSGTRVNYLLDGAGFNDVSCVLRRIPRMIGVPIEDYLTE